MYPENSNNEFNFKAKNIKNIKYKKNNGKTIVNNLIRIQQDKRNTME